MLTSDEGIETRLSEPAIADIVRVYLLDEFLLGVGSVTDDASLLESGTVDSTGIVELATYLEVRFGIELDDDDMTAANLDSVGRIARFVARKQAAASTGDRAVE
jgi:acyl carrier protein